MPKYFDRKIVRKGSKNLAVGRNGGKRYQNWNRNKKWWKIRKRRDYIRNLSREDGKGQAI